MASPAYRSHSLDSANATTITPATPPVGATQNDILVATIYMEANTTITPPAGWSDTFNGSTISQTLSSGGQAYKTQAFWIRHGASAPSYTFTIGGTFYVELVVTAFSGAVATGDPWSFGAGATRNDLTTNTWPDVSGTTLSADETLVWFGLNYVGGSGSGQPTGYTIRQNSAGKDTYSADKAQATPASVTATGAGWGSTAGVASTMLFGLRSTPFIVTARGTGTSVTGTAASSTIGPFTPSNNSLLVVVGSQELDSTTANENFGATPASGGSLTYTERLSYKDTAAPIFNTAENYRLNSAMFTAPVVTGASLSVVLDLTASLLAYTCDVVAEITGHNVAAPIVQSAKNFTENNGYGFNSVSLAVTLGATPVTGNLVVVSFGASVSNIPVGFAAPTIGTKSMTQVYNVVDGYCHTGLWYRVIDGTETNAVITCTDLGDSVGGAAAFAIEVAKAGATATVPAAITDLAGTVGNTQVPLTHSAPSDGGSAILDYVYQYRPA